MYYHASQVAGIKTLEPRISNHGVPLVYFSKKRENVLVYLSNAIEKYCKETGFTYDGPWQKWGPYGFEQNGRLRIEEYYPGMLQETYQGVSGYIYQAEQLPKGQGEFANGASKQNCASEDEKADGAMIDLQIPDAVVSSLPVNVTGAEFIPDAYDAIMEAERKGLIMILRYEDFSEKKKQWLRGVIAKEYEEAADHPEYRYFLKNHFVLPGGLAWEPVKTEHLLQDEWIDFRREEYLMPDGTVFAPFYNYSKRDYAVILARDEEGKYLCVKQYRHGIRKVTTEFVAGGLEYAANGAEAVGGLEYVANKSEAAGGLKNDAMAKSVVKDDARDDKTDTAKPRELLPGMREIVYEDALDAAKRELLEETGYVSEEWEKLITIPSHATLSDDYVHVFLAKNCHKVSGQELDDTEFLNVVRFTEEELEALIAAGEFQQAVHVMAWYLAKSKGYIS